MLKILNVQFMSCNACVLEEKNTLDKNFLVRTKLKVVVYRYLSQHLCPV